MSGDRLLNGRCLAANKYESLMRKQAFVEQTDVHLATLTVWETLAYAAMLRLPETLPPQHKINRAREVRGYSSGYVLCGRYV